MFFYLFHLPTKLRPALVIHEGSQDVVVVFISSKIPAKVSDVDVLVTKEDSGFERSGLKVDSVIKLDKVATILKDLVLGELGELNRELRDIVNQNMRRVFVI